MWTTTTPSTWHYCRGCAYTRGYLSDVYSTMVGSTKQEDWTAKHTGRRPARGPRTSILYRSSSSGYEDHVRETALEGFVVIDDTGRRRFVRQSTGYIGYLVENHRATDQHNAFASVRTSDPSLVHGFSVSSTEYLGVACDGCGCTLIW